MKVKVELSSMLHPHVEDILRLSFCRYPHRILHMQIFVFGVQSDGFDRGYDGMATPAIIADRKSDPLARVKTISLIGGISLLTNNITGPGMISANHCDFVFDDVPRCPWACGIRVELLLSKVIARATAPPRSE